MAVCFACLITYKHKQPFYKLNMTALIVGITGNSGYKITERIRHINKLQLAHVI